MEKRLRSRKDFRISCGRIEMCDDVCVTEVDERESFVLPKWGSLIESVCKVR